MKIEDAERQIIRAWNPFKQQRLSYKDGSIFCVGNCHRVRPFDAHKFYALKSRICSFYPVGAKRLVKWVIDGYTFDLAPMAHVLGE